MVIRVCRYVTTDNLCPPVIFIDGTEHSLDAVKRIIKQLQVAVKEVSK